MIEERRNGSWVERPLANAEFRYYSDPTIRVPNDLTNQWRLKVTSQRTLLLGFGTNQWNVSQTSSTLRSEVLPALPELQEQSRRALNRKGR